MIVFDATFLLYLVREPGTVGVPLDSGGKPVELARERVQALVSELQKTNTKIILPTPALAEVMVRAGVEAAQKYLAILNKSAVFRIVAFDTRAAMETAMMQGHELTGERARVPTSATYAKLKYDRQIAAIAKVEGASTLYTDDIDLRRFAERHGLAVRGLEDLAVPTELAQTELELFLPGANDTEPED